MIVDLLFNNVSAGEVSPLSVARTDLPRVLHGAKLLENFLVLTQGGITRRPGLRYVAGAKFNQRLARLLPFEPSVTDAYILETGDSYLRFYKAGARIESSGVPIEVVTPYTEADLRQIRTAQANDVMILVHPSHPPAQLSRLSDTSWTYKAIQFDPPPLFEAGESPSATLTPSALTGTITLTASAAVFLPADVDRVIQAGDARAAITAYIGTNQVTAEVLSAFSSLSAIAAGDWTIQGSPVADLDPNKKQPRGAIVTLRLQLTQNSNATLVTNGDFASALTGWTNLSGPVLTTGTHTGAMNTAILEDSTKNFYNVGVQPGHSVRNTTDGSRGAVLRIRGTIQLELEDIGGGAVLAGGTDNDFDTGDAYTVQGTGGAEGRNGRAYLTGGLIGIGWIEQGVATVVGSSYRLVFDVSENPVSAQVGSTSGLADVKEELSYVQGLTHEVVFTATSTTSYLQFRNNQPSAGAVDNVACRLQGIDGFRSTDVGKYLRINDGLVKLTAFVSASQMKGQILRELSTGDTALAGAWQLLDTSWSATLGYPSVVAFFEGRLYFAGSARFPQTLWGSAIDDFFNFAPGVNDDEAVEFTITDSAGNITLNQIRWLMPAENLLAGTTHGEYRLTGPTEGAFTPSSPPLVRLQSTFGSDAVQPLRVGQALLFAQRQGSKLRQMAFDAESASTFLARDLSILSGHLLEDFRIVEMAYQAEPLSLVWAVRSDGVALALTYDLLEEVVAWHHHTTDGAIESIAVIPHPTANAHQTWMSVKRTIQGVERHFIEYVDDQSVMSYLDVDGNTVSWKGLTVDAGLVYDGVPTATITGLTYLNGKMVHIVGDGVVFPVQQVAGGQVTLPQAVSVAFVGLAYTPDAELLPPEVATQRGSIQGRQKAYKEITVQLYQTVGLTLQGEPLPFRNTGMALGLGIPPYTGDILLDGLLSSGDRKPTIRAVQPNPLPVTILSLLGALEVALDQ